MSNDQGLQMTKADLPLVCIGLPTFNGERFLARALDSLLAQDYPNFRLIISDNASTDSTKDICQRYVAADPRVSYVRQAANVGPLPNFISVAMAAGDAKYFMWAADDDVWQPDFIRALVAELEAHPDAGVAMSATEMVDPEGKQIKVVRFAGEDDPNQKDHYQMLRGVTGRGKEKRKYNFYIYGLYRVALLRKAVHHFPVHFVPDRGFVCQLALATRFRYVDRPLYIRTIHPSSGILRYANEPFSKPYYHGVLTRLHSVLDLGRVLLQSRIIPFHRKRHIPMALWRLRSYVFEKKVA